MFDGPVQEKSRRKKLGGKDAGTDNIFGRDTFDYGNKSNNMNVLT